MGSDPRIGLPFLYAGVGYGGSCFPKDVQAFVQTGASMGVDMSLLEEVEKVNEQQKNWAIQKIAESYPDQAAVKVAIWGGAFKPETDDIRDAPSISVISDLLARKVVVSLYDPEAMSGLRALFPSGVQYCENPYDVLKDADILLLLTEWREFRNPDWDQVKSLMKGNLVLDGRNQYEASDLAVHGLSCVGVGRGCITGQP
jgi:UDPglucose 6-dehydrogenase